MKKLKIIFAYKYITSAIIIFIIALMFTNLYEYKSKYKLSDEFITGYIHNLNINGNKLTITLIGKEKIIINYYIKTKEEKNKFISEYKLGDYLNCYGKMKEPPKNTVFNLFNYQKYLYNNHIYYMFEAEELKKIKNNNKIIYDIKNKLSQRISKLKSKTYVDTFVLSNMKGIDSNIVSAYQEVGIIHLFAVSGSHITLLSTIILFILNKLKVNNSKYIVVIGFIIMYMALVNFLAAVLRAGIFFIITSLNKIFKLKINVINIMLLTFIILVIINPFIIYDVGFQYSYSISLTLVIIQKTFLNIKKYLISAIRISIISFIISLPITINNFFQINFMSIIYNLIFIPMVSIIIFPLSLLTLCMPTFDKLLYFCTSVMESLSVYCKNITFGTVIVPKINIIWVVIFYLIITFFILNISKYKNHLYLFVITFIFVFSNSHYFNRDSTLTMIDVSQGDCFLISLSHGRGNILIDTGGKMEYYQEDWEKKNSNSSIATNTIIPFLKSKGIKKIDYLFLTHGDEDHMGESIRLINNYKIDKVFFNSGKLNRNEQLLINKLNLKRIPYKLVIAGNNIKISNYLFQIINPIKDLNENDNSIVIYIVINNHKILLMGDVSKKIEEELIKQYNLENIDILKIGHHGSKTSSSEKFIKYINPSYSLISVGEDNKFNHPNIEVINVLNKYKSKIYQTSKLGSVEINLEKTITFQTVN